MKVSLSRFLIAAAVLLGASVLLAQSGLLDPVRASTAQLAWYATSAVGLETTLLGCEIFTRSRVLDVATTCLPIGVLAVYLAVVAATDTSWRNRALGAAAGLAALLLANVARVIVGVWAAQTSPGLFDALHGSVLQLVPIATAFATWLVWARWSRG